MTNADKPEPLPGECHGGNAPAVAARPKMSNADQQDANPGREMTPEELFDKAAAQRRKLYPVELPEPGNDLPLLALMADQRAHQRTNAKLDRLLEAIENHEEAASEFRGDCYIQTADKQGEDRRAGAYLGVAAATIIWLVAWLLTRAW